MKANLHMHSKFSDGTMWPEEIVARAKRFGLEIMSLTDHDSMEGVNDFLRSCTYNNIIGIAGVEIDCVAPEINYNIELLGYFPHGSFNNTNNFLKDELIKREKKIKKYLIQAEDKYKKKFDFEELKTMKIGFLNDHVLNVRFSFNKVDVYEYLLHKKVIHSSIAYKEFKKTDIFQIGENDTKPHVAEIIKLIRSDNGYPVLPHPGHIVDDDYDRIIKEENEFNKKIHFFKNAGIWGIEFYFYRDNCKKINQIFENYAEKYNLRCTFGSDCHGRGSRSDTLEQFYGNFNLKWE